MRIQIKLLIIGICAILSACDKLPGNDVEKMQFDLVNINDQYQVALPSFMSEASNLSEDASLQYQSLFKELYTVVVDESLSEFKDGYQEIDYYDDALSVLDNYVKIQYESIIEELDITSDVVQKSVKINGLPARIIEFDAKVEDIDVPITYYYTFYEGDDDLYLMLSWTLKSRRTKYQPVLEKIAKSFRLIQDKD
ncbi:MAG: hypothetical protein ACI9JN_001177 [Bacteroidia bacterium]|jgi:hypothetical protein